MGVEEECGRGDEGTAAGSGAGAEEPPLAGVEKEEERGWPTWPPPLAPTSCVVWAASALALSGATVWAGHPR